MESSGTYYIAKCASMTSLRTAQQSLVWACSDRSMDPQPRHMLCDSYKQGIVTLVFSVNDCHGWHGIAQLTSQPIAQIRTLRGMSNTDLSDQTADVSTDSTDQSTAKNNADTKGFHYFTLSWRLLYLVDHGEQCLPFSSTTHFMTTDGTPLNRARNYQTLSSQTGDALCKMMVEHYEKLSAAKMAKLELKRARRPAPFFQPKFIADANASATPVPLSTASATHSDAPNSSVIWSQLLEHVKQLGRVFIACSFGSQRYNLHTSDSDTDMLVVYVADTPKMLGFNAPKLTIKNTEDEDYDYTIYELYRFCELLRGGDPKCVETLFMENSTIYYQCEQWAEFKTIKKYALTKECANKYLNDARGSKGIRQMKKWEENGDTDITPLPQKVCKLAYIIIRLLQNANQVLNGDLQVYRCENSTEYQMLMKVRRKNCNYAEIQEIINSLQDEISKHDDDGVDEGIGSEGSRFESWGRHVEQAMLKIRFKNYTMIDS